MKFNQMRLAVNLFDIYDAGKSIKTDNKSDVQNEKEKQRGRRIKQYSKNKRIERNILLPLPFSSLKLEFQ